MPYKDSLNPFAPMVFSKKPKDGDFFLKTVDDVTCFVRDLHCNCEIIKNKVISSAFEG